MYNNNINHWKPVGENKNSTTFDGSLHSKMIQIKLYNDKMDNLNAKKIKNFFNLIRRNSVVHKEELIKWMEKVKRHNETVSDFIHQVKCNKGDEHGRRKKNK